MVGEVFSELSGTVVDIGSKYHTLPLFSNHLKVIAMRPRIFDYDEAYLNKYPKGHFMQQNPNIYVDVKPAMTASQYGVN